MKSILVVGGAGYIGSHMVKMLLEGGHSVVTLDSLVTGHRDAVLGGEFVHGDLADENLLNNLFRSQRFDGVMHFASLIQVGESVQQPGKYYRNNVAGTLNLLDAMVANSVNRLIFSSTAAVYGNPHYTPIDEAHPKDPINPYGQSKWMVEQMLADYDRAYGLKSVCLRYFNAAGAARKGNWASATNRKPTSFRWFCKLLPVCVTASKCSATTTTRRMARVSGTMCT